jgi:hypothetical protein
MTGISTETSGATMEIQRLTAASEIAACQRLRFEVWSAEGVELSNPEAATIADSHDDHAMHWGVFDGTRLVGAARLCLHEALAEAPDGDLFTGLTIPSPVASMTGCEGTGSQASAVLGHLGWWYEGLGAAKLCTVLSYDRPKNGDSKLPALTR